MAGSKQIITTTTVNHVTAAIREYDRMPDWELLVVGDDKTPPYKLQRGEYLSWEWQQEHYPDLCKLLGPGSVQRGRMIAFIEAWKRGAEVMASIDDDCYPMDGWGAAETVHVGKPTKVKMFGSTAVAFNPYGCVLRHRGFPRDIEVIQEENHELTITPLVQENSSIGDPDVDAVDRISKRPHFQSRILDRPYSSVCFCPINTQNTFFAREAIPDFYGNIPGIGRMDDIWAGYLFQAMHPGTVIYASANNVQMQNRTLESMLNDLEAEIYGYRETYNFLDYLADGYEMGYAYLPDNSKKAIELYKAQFV